MLHTHTILVLTAKKHPYNLSAMKPIIVLLLVFSVLLLSGCAGAGVQVLSQTEIQYPAVPANHVTVSKYPPKGSYKVIAVLTVEQFNTEAPLHTVGRMQAKAASLGADYLQLVGLDSNTYLAPATVDTFSTGSTYATVSPNGYDSGYHVSGFDAGDATTTITPAHNYSLITVSGKALKIVSGSTEPDMAAKVSLSQEDSKPSRQSAPQHPIIKSDSPAETTAAPVAKPQNNPGVD